MRLSTVGPKRGRSLQLECLEDRNLLSTAVTTIRAHATGTFSNGALLSNSPPTVITTINAQGTAQGFGLVTAAAQDTTTLSVRGKKVTVILSNGTGTLSDPLGDKVFFTFTARGPFTSATKFKPSGVGIITGGTGLFAHAHGRITAQANADISTGTFSIDIVARASL